MFQLHPPSIVSRVNSKFIVRSHSRESPWTLNLSPGRQEYTCSTAKMTSRPNVGNDMTNAPVILTCFGRYVVPAWLTPTFRRNQCWFQLDATLCHDVLRFCHAIATPGPRYCPVLTCLTSDTGKFCYVVLRYVSLPSRCSLAAPMLSFDMPRCALCFAIATQQPRDSFGVYKPSDM